MVKQRESGEMRKARFGHLVCAMATPFDAAGRLDLDAAVSLANYLVEHGNQGLVVTGTTGEAPTLSDEEKITLWREIKKSVNVPVIAGSTDNDTAHSIELTVAAEAAGVDGIMAVTPYYNRPAQSGIVAHFEAVAAATSLPMIIYDIPMRTGRKIARDTLLHMAETIENFVALKDAAGDPGDSARLLAHLPDGFECYSGDDHLTLPLLSIGAVGLISVAAHWCGEELVEMIELFLRGEIDEALEIERALIDSFVYETSDDAPNPVPTKTMLAVLGLRAGDCRLPMGKAPDFLEDRAKAVIGELDHWRQQRRLRA